MKEDIAKIWVDALRSGDYSQGEGHLCKDGNYCCLGVLCDLFADRHDIEDFARPLVKITQYEEETEIMEYDGLDDLLPSIVMRWSGMQSDNGSLVDIKSVTAVSSLAEMNDDGMSFNDIADIIEREWPNL